MKRASVKPPKNKRRAGPDFFWILPRRKLGDRLASELLPPRPAGGLSLADFVAGKPDPQSEWDRRRDELEWEIARCFFKRSRPEDDDYEEIPWQIEAWHEDLKKEGFEDASEDDATKCLLASTLELEQETRDYLAKEWSRRVPRPSPPDAARQRREWGEAVVRLKAMLKERGVSKGKADDIIAEVLGVPSGETLRKQLVRARK